MSFEPFAVVTVPFPFADRTRSVVRPAVVLTRHAEFGQTTGVALVAMITTAGRSSWPFDVAIGDLDAAGLRVPCVVRMKLNTIDYGLIDKQIGMLADADRTAVRSALNSLLGE